MPGRSRFKETLRTHRAKRSGACILLERYVGPRGLVWRAKRPPFATETPYRFEQRLRRARLALWRVARGLAAGAVVDYESIRARTCGNDLCVSPDHATPARV